MPAAPLPEDETERVRTLRHTGLLESDANPCLAAIVQCAAMLFGAPIAAVSLLEATRQDFKASVGRGRPHTGRDKAFCGYTVPPSRSAVCAKRLAKQHFRICIGSWHPVCASMLALRSTALRATGWAP